MGITSSINSATNNQSIILSSGEDIKLPQVQSANATGMPEQERCEHRFLEYK
ncbi:MAG: hypothetical protein RR681_07875 [Lachnospiraceae bacterium]